MAKGLKLESIIANSVNNSLQEKENTRDYASREITAAIKQAILAEAENEASPLEMAEGDTVAYYIARTCEELANKIKDIRFESNNAFNYGKAVVSNVTTDDDNTTKVTVVQTFEVAPTRETKSEVEALIGKFRTLAVPPKFAKYISVSSVAGEDGASVELSIVFNLPEVYIQVIGAEDFLKRNSVVSKEIKKIVDNYLG